MNSTTSGTTAGTFMKRDTTARKIASRIRRRIKRFSSVPEIRCENADKASLTSFAALVIFQNLFSQLGIKQRLRRCFDHLRKSAAYRGHDIVFWWIVHW